VQAVKELSIHIRRCTPQVIVGFVFHSALSETCGPKLTFFSETEPCSVQLLSQDNTDYLSNKQIKQSSQKKGPFILGNGRMGMFVWLANGPASSHLSASVQDFIIFYRGLF
jgi:hypothetical protein